MEKAKPAWQAEILRGRFFFLKSDVRIFVAAPGGKAPWYDLSGKYPKYI
ncbi:MAG: hypothetical protein RDV48_01595 [Candidatus Eremiobacteraeota bacterium]|nr:hypothetical protein [Candidatus Eremiobacteraeota bacterium]